MRVGVPKEITAHGSRMGLPPGAIPKYAVAGHRVVAETNTGARICETDDNYREAGPTIADSAREVFASSEKIVNA
ncbi:hypothetical protein ACFIOY_18635 [Bradyrhizobium sp. TZ2]